jgi:hypothetical protein
VTRATFVAVALLVALVPFAATTASAAAIDCDPPVAFGPCPPFHGGRSTSVCGLGTTLTCIYWGE